MSTADGNSRFVDTDDIQAQLDQLLAKVQVGEDRQKTCETRLDNLDENLNQFQQTEVTSKFEDIATDITSGEQIVLDPYKAIPEFSGEKIQYRSWREQVMRDMGVISRFKTHPKYQAALAIIRAKITKGASDVLISNKTAFNIDAIINRLDFAYADQRPLYIVEAERPKIATTIL